MHDNHIHRGDDGRGKRKVYVNGNEIDNVVMADTRKGLVEFAPEPIRIKRNGDIYTRMLRGQVVVEPVGGGNSQ